MKLVLAGHLAGISGTLGEMNMYSVGGGRAIGRNKPGKQGRDLTIEQRIQMSFMSVSNAHWKQLSPANQIAWQDYAARYFGSIGYRKRVRVTGRTTYVASNNYRQLLGLPLVEAAPTKPSTEILLEVRQDSDVPSTSLGLRITKLSQDDADGHVVLVRMTPPTPSPAAKVRLSGFRYVQGSSAASSRPMPQSEGVVTFENVRYPVELGQRYGVEVRVVRVEDGVAGRARILEFVRGQERTITSGRVR